MTILTIRTDKAEAELGIFHKNRETFCRWNAGHELSADIHRKIEQLLKNAALNWSQLEGIIFFEGPGSFTGLRIGASVANALASQLDIPVVQAGGAGWANDGQKLLSSNADSRAVVPNYGREPHITKPKK